MPLKRGGGGQNWGYARFVWQECVPRTRATQMIDMTLSSLNQRRHDRLYLHGPHPHETMVWNHGLHPLRTMVLKSPSATTSMFFSIARCQRGDFQDHGSEGVQTMVPDHGFARVGTMQVQAILPRSTQTTFDVVSKSLLNVSPTRHLLVTEKIRTPHLGPPI